METINERVKAVRVALGMTQKQFAERIGLKTGTVGMYDSGQNNVTEQSIMLICTRFNVSEAWLRTGDGRMFNADDGIEELQSELGLTDDDTRFIRTFLTFPPEVRARGIEFALEFTERYKSAAPDTEQEIRRQFADKHNQLDREEQKALAALKTPVATLPPGDLEGINREADAVIQEITWMRDEAIARGEKTGGAG